MIHSGWMQTASHTSSSPPSPPPLPLKHTHTRPKPQLACSSNRDGHRHQMRGRSLIRIRIRIDYWWHINWYTFTRVNEWEDYSLDLINDVNLEMQSSEHSAEDTIDAGSAFQSLIVSRKKTMPISISPSIWDLKWFWMMVSSMPKRGFKVINWYVGLTFLDLCKTIWVYYLSAFV